MHEQDAYWISVSGDLLVKTQINLAQTIGLTLLLIMPYILFSTWQFTCKLSEYFKGWIKIDRLSADNQYK